MYTGRKRFSISLVLAASLLLSSAASAQDTPAATGDWSGLKTVTPGSKLAVKLKSGKTVKGKLSGISDTALSLSVGDKTVDFNRDDVHRVHRVGGQKAAQATLIGAGVGAGMGVVAGVAGGDEDGFGPTKSQAAAALGVVGAGVGALVGLAIGKSRHRRVLIYEARQP